MRPAGRSFPPPALYYIIVCKQIIKKKIKVQSEKLNRTSKDQSVEAVDDTDYHDRGVRSPHLNECPVCDTKPSDCETPVLELWVM